MVLSCGWFVCGLGLGWWFFFGGGGVELLCHKIIDRDF